MPKLFAQSRIQAPSRNIIAPEVAMKFARFICLFALSAIATAFLVQRILFPG